MTSVSLSCSICSGTIENPVTCKHCGNSFCNDCAERSKKKKKNVQIVQCHLILHLMKE